MRAVLIRYGRATKKFVLEKVIHNPLQNFDDFILFHTQSCDNGLKCIEMPVL